MQLVVAFYAVINIYVACMNSFESKKKMHTQVVAYLRACLHGKNYSYAIVRVLAYCSSMSSREHRALFANSRHMRMYIDKLLSVLLSGQQRTNGNDSNGNSGVRTTAMSPWMGTRRRDEALISFHWKRQPAFRPYKNVRPATHRQYSHDRCTVCRKGIVGTAFTEATEFDAQLSKTKRHAFDV